MGIVSNPSIASEESNLSPAVTAEDDDYEDYAPESPVLLSVGDVYLLDPAYLDRESGVTGPIAVRVTEDQEVEYLDGEARIWMNAAAQKGPHRH